jgi:hypothetical protein
MLGDRLGPNRHRARTLNGRRARIATKLLALAAGVGLNHDIDQPTRSFAALAPNATTRNQSSRGQATPGRALRGCQCSGRSGCVRKTMWSSVPEAATASQTTWSACSRSSALT